jgi:hypothetical protein
MQILLEGISTMSRKLAFLVAAALALAITTIGANAAPLNPATATLAAESNLVLTHGCHKLCVSGPHGSPYPHRHAMFSCEPRRCLFDWGSLLGNPVIYKRRR